MLSVYFSNCLLILIISSRNSTHNNTKSRGIFLVFHTEFSFCFLACRAKHTDTCPKLKYWHTYTRKNAPTQTHTNVYVKPTHTQRRTHPTKSTHILTIMREKWANLRRSSSGGVVNGCVLCFFSPYFVLLFFIEISSFVQFAFRERYFPLCLWFPILIPPNLLPNRVFYI